MICLVIISLISAKQFQKCNASCGKQRIRSNNDKNCRYKKHSKCRKRVFCGKRQIISCREGEERQTAFDISNAEQIQTEISDVYPASNHFICSCVSVEIEYYTENGVNIATRLTSNGQEIAPLYFKE